MSSSSSRFWGFIYPPDGASNRRRSRKFAKKILNRRERRESIRHIQESIDENTLYDESQEYGYWGVEDPYGWDLGLSLDPMYEDWLHDHDAPDSRLYDSWPYDDELESYYDESSPLDRDTYYENFHAIDWQEYQRLKSQSPLSKLSDVIEEVDRRLVDSPPSSARTEVYKALSLLIEAKDTLAHVFGVT